MRKHIPVLLDEVIEGLKLKPNYNVIDATLGGGGHAQAILKKIAPQGKLVGFDLDLEAIKLAKNNLKEYRDRVIYVPVGYQKLKQKRNEQFKHLKFHGILLDLGLSLYQLQEQERGFSFLGSSSLDMRYDRNLEEINAEHIINNFKENELADIFYKYGEERLSRQIAHLIVQRRVQEKINTPEKLVKIIELVYKSKFKNKSKKHPATKVFQALRIYVNHELENIREFLPQAINLLESGARLAVITYHSLEDRIVKQYFKQESKDCLCPPELPECRCNHKASIKIINRKVIVSNSIEIKNNPAARSAKLRIIEKI